MYRKKHIISFPAKKTSKRKGALLHMQGLRTAFVLCSTNACKISVWEAPCRGSSQVPNLRIICCFILDYQPIVLLIHACVLNVSTFHIGSILKHKQHWVSSFGQY